MLLPSDGRPHLADDEGSVSLNEGATAPQHTILGPFGVSLDDIDSLEFLVSSPFIERRDGNLNGAARALDKAGGVMSIGRQERSEVPDSSASATP